MSPQTARRSLAVLFLVNVLNFYDRQALGAVLEPLRHEFLLSDTQLGGLTALFTVVYAIAGLPLGRRYLPGVLKAFEATGRAAFKQTENDAFVSTFSGTHFVTPRAVQLQPTVPF